MDWDLGVVPESVNKSVSFHQLLDNLRYVHEEVCARNVQLERQMAYNRNATGGINPSAMPQAAEISMGHVSSTGGDMSMGHVLSAAATGSHSPLAAHRSTPPANHSSLAVVEPINIREDPWSPSLFIAPRDGPAPHRPVRVSSTPRSYVVQATDLLSRQQEYIHESIDTLIHSQDYLTSQVDKILSDGVHMPVRGGKGAKGMGCQKNARKAANHGNDGGHDGHHAQSPVKESRFLSMRMTRTRSEEDKEKRCTEKRNPQKEKVCLIDVREKDSPNNAPDEKDVVAEKKKPKGKKICIMDAGDVAEQSEEDEAAPSPKQSKKQSAIVRATMRFAVQTKTTADFNAEAEAEFANNHSDQQKETGSLSLRQKMRNILSSTSFSLFSSLLIFSYAVLIGIETNLMASDPDMESPLIVKLHYIFTCVFAFEFMLRVAVDGCNALRGEEGKWNRLDAFFILSGLSEIIMESVASSEGAGSAASIIRGVRICRVFRTVRLVRTFRQFYEFQKMAYALLSSLKTLLCSLALLAFVMYFFAVWFTQSAADSQARVEIENLDLRYGDMMSTMYSLFLSVSGGISWDECYKPLFSLSLFSAQGFILYIIIVLFGVLNVVTSVFVESVIRSVQHYKDIIVKDKEEEKKIAAAHVQEVFNQIDNDGTGEVTIDEMEYFLQEPALRKYMEALDIDFADTRLLFRLLDSDESGVINVEEFCDGCLALKGDAKSIDIHALTFQVKNFLDKWGEFTGYVEENFIAIKDTMAKTSFLKSAKARLP